MLTGKMYSESGSFQRLNTIKMMEINFSKNYIWRKKEEKVKRKKAKFQKLVSGSVSEYTFFYEI